MGEQRQDADPRRSSPHRVLNGRSGPVGADENRELGAATFPDTLRRVSRRETQRERAGRAEEDPDVRSGESPRPRVADQVAVPDGTIAAARRLSRLPADEEDHRANTTTDVRSCSSEAAFSSTTPVTATRRLDLGRR